MLDLLSLSICGGSLVLLKSFHGTLVLTYLLFIDKKSSAVVVVLF